MTLSAPDRFVGAVARSLEGVDGLTPGAPVVVALSGGIDSMALLHLLRFVLPRRVPGFPELELHPAHLDHAMRAGSGEDAGRLAARMDAWSLPLHLERADPPPGNETEARRRRYRFLRRVRSKVEARWILTGHHAGDQRETVLFRILRGTGIRGLRGMREIQPPDLARPMLAVERAWVEAYLAEAGVSPIEDPTNRDPRYARNRIRHEVIPLLEEIHPGASRSLLRLARRAREAEAVQDHLLAPHLERLLVEGREVAGAEGGARPGEAFPMARARLLVYPAPVRAELVRALAGRLGVRLSEAGTEAALAFISRGSSGGRLHLAGSLVLSRDFTIITLSRSAYEERGPIPEAEPLALPPFPASGEARIVAGRREFRVRWSGLPEDRELAGTGWRASFRPDDLAFPLIMRARGAGDRTWHPKGRRRLKNVFQELRIPRERRDELPLLLDRDGRVLWIPGHWRAPLPPPSQDGERWSIEVEDVRAGA